MRTTLLLRQLGNEGFGFAFEVGNCFFRSATVEIVDAPEFDAVEPPWKVALNQRAVIGFFDGDKC